MQGQSVNVNKMLLQNSYNISFMAPHYLMTFSIVLTKVVLDWHPVVKYQLHLDDHENALGVFLSTRYVLVIKTWN